MPEKFYLTTPIYYVNARPHIGHAYTTIVADVLARRARAQGTDTWFLTGTDEHGQKIERSAAAAGIPPQHFADAISAQFRTLWDRMGLTYDQFIRTTDPAHKLGVQKLFTTLQENGHIYLDSYTGAYCVSDETFVDVPTGTPCPDCGRPTETVTEENYFFRLSTFQLPLLDLIESNTLQIEPDSRRNEVLSFLRGNVMGELGPYVQSANQQLRALNLWGDGVNATLEEAIEFLKKVKGGALGRAKLTSAGDFYVPGALKDLSISRSSFTWGIPVPASAVIPDEVRNLSISPSSAAPPPSKEDHVIYVWLDALANYLTAVGYGDDSLEAQAKFAKYWPADLHIVGKEIIRFHCVYWPAFLLAAGLPLPKKIVAHGWLLFDDSKMSKSKGNIVRTETILEAFGTLCPVTSLPLAPTVILDEVQNLSISPGPPQPTPHDRDLFAADVLRYFLLREIPFGQDGSFSFEALITRYNADLANGYGNLVSRTLSMVSTLCSWRIPAEASTEGFHKVFDPFLVLPQNLNGSLYELYTKLNFSRDLEVLTGLVSATDNLLDRIKPWRIAKDVQILGSKGELTKALERKFQTQIDDVLYTAAESIRIITALLRPILPYATASVWRQLGLGDIEQAAARGDLKNLQWGGLQPGTRLGPLSPIFPRIEKKDIPRFIQQMTDLESPTPLAAVTTQQDATPPPKSDFPEAPVASQSTPNQSVPLSVKSVVGLAPDAAPTFDPAAPPRTSTLPEPNPGAQVAASAALTTERPDPTVTLTTPADASPQITIDDFAKVELRVAQIVLAERIPKADKLLRLEVDLGHEKRQILSGIAQWYTPEDLLGRRIVVITNLAPRTMRGLQSHGMLLAASTEGGKPHLATIDSPDLPLGSRLK